MTSWNKFCFTGGYIEANVSLPGVNNIVGLWPAIWTMGNLGRAGYGASLEGMVCTFHPIHHGRLDADHDCILSICRSKRILCGLTYTSGHTHTTHATSARWRTRPSTTCPRLRRSTATPDTMGSFPSFPGKSSRGVRVRVRRTRVPNIATAASWAGLRRKSTCSRHRSQGRR